jgi:hypothetical protein
MPNTPTLLLPYPAPTDPADVPTDMGELATRIETVRGLANGLASLDATGKVPAAQLPATSAAISGPIAVQLANPRVSSLQGNAFYTVVGLTAWDAGHWEFIKDVEGRVYGTVAIPPGVTLTAATFRLRLAANAVAGITRMSLKAAVVAAGGNLNPATLTAVGVARDLTVPATAYGLIETTFAMAAPPAAGSLILIEVTHEGAHANDTLAVNTLLLGAWLEVA